MMLIRDEATGCGAARQWVRALIEIRRSGMPGLYEMYSDKLLLEEMRKKSATSFEYPELQAELDRRVAMKTMKAATAQVWSA
jgi:hypothetical protein